MDTHGYVFLGDGRALGTGFNLTANFGGFRPTFYRQTGCKSGACEAVDELKSLMVSKSNSDPQ